MGFWDVVQKGLNYASDVVKYGKPERILSRATISTNLLRAAAGGRMTPIIGPVITAGTLGYTGGKILDKYTDLSGKAARLGHYIETYKNREKLFGSKYHFTSQRTKDALRYGPPKIQTINGTKVRVYSLDPKRTGKVGTTGTVKPPSVKPVRIIKPVVKPTLRYPRSKRVTYLGNVKAISPIKKTVRYLPAQSPIKTPIRHLLAQSPIKTPIRHLLAQSPIKKPIRHLPAQSPIKKPIRYLPPQKVVRFRGR